MKKTQRIALALALAGLLSSAATQAKGPAPAQLCAKADKDDIAALFDGWNAALRSGDPQQVVARYAPDSVLLATVANEPKLTPEKKAAYFAEFLKKRPDGRIAWRRIDIDCTLAVDSGLYTFDLAGPGTMLHARYTFVYRRDGRRWSIVAHHSSAMPEKIDTAANGNGGAK